MSCLSTLFILETSWNKGDNLFTNIQPWIAIVTHDKVKTTCPGCFLPGKAPDQDICCEDCGLVCYCSWACRAKDELHGYECELLRGCGLQVPERDEVRVMIRAIGRLTSDNTGVVSLEGGHGDTVPGRKGLRVFSHLLSHRQDFLANKQKMQDIQTLYDETEEYLQDRMPNFETFIEILGRLYINGFEICDERMETYGWGVYLGPSVLDHSCQPNCVVSFKGNRLTVTATQNFTSLDDARICYLNPKLPTQLRQEKLYNNYFFRCQCLKCVHSHYKPGQDCNNNNKNLKKHKAKR